VNDNVFFRVEVMERWFLCVFVSVELSKRPNNEKRSIEMEFFVEGIGWKNGNN
jgi:hypothetical protein